MAFFFIGAAMLFGIANLAAKMIDQRENEERYVWLRFLTRFIGWSRLMVGVLLPLGI